VEKENMYSLIISDLTRKDSGTYTCIATNEAGKTTLRSYLGVKEKKVVVPQTLETLEKELKFDVGDIAPVTCAKGQQTTLSFTIEGNPEVIWYKDGKRIVETSNFYFQRRQDTYILVIKGVSSEDSGTYTCEARTTLGTSIFKAFNITIKGIWISSHDPRFLDIQDNVDHLLIFLSFPFNHLVIYSDIYFYYYFFSRRTKTSSKRRTPNY
jgi:hypothetical protein